MPNRKNKAKNASRSKKAATAPMSSVIKAMERVGQTTVSSAANVLQSITGNRNLNVTSNTLWSNGGPALRQRRDGLQWHDTERIAAVTGSTGFNMTTQLINPGNVNLFPKLSNLARNFESYEFKGLVFSYVPRSGTATSSPGQGIIGLATQMNTLSNNFTSMTELENYKYGVARAPYKEIWHPVECRKNSTPFTHQFITDVTSVDDLPIRADPNTYFHGKLHTATDGNVDGTSILGEIWVSYDVVLYTMKVIPSSLTYRGTLSRYVAVRHVAYQLEGDHNVYQQNPSFITPPLELTSDDSMVGSMVLTDNEGGNGFWIFTPPVPGIWQIIRRLFVAPKSGVLPTGGTAYASIPGSMNSGYAGVVPTFQYSIIGGPSDPNFNHDTLSNEVLQSAYPVGDPTQHQLHEINVTIAAGKTCSLGQWDPASADWYSSSVPATGNVEYWYQIDVRLLEATSSNEYDATRKTRTLAIPPPSPLTRQSAYTDDVRGNTESENSSSSSSSSSSATLTSLRDIPPSKEVGKPRKVIDSPIPGQLRRLHSIKEQPSATKS